MRKTILVLGIALMISGCARLAESRLNPVNWFGRSVEATAPNPAAVRPLVPQARVAVVDARQPIEQIVEMRLDRRPGGAVLTATGLAARQGYFNAELVLVGFENGTLVFQFRAEQPATATPVGAEASRRITAARLLTDSELGGVRTVRVEGAANARVARR